MNLGDLLQWALHIGSQSIKPTHVRPVKLTGIEKYNASPGFSYKTSEDHQINMHELKAS